jgi:hypothetical protein
MSGDARFRCAPGSRGYVWGAAEIAQLLIDLEISARDALPDDTETPERLYLGVVTTTPVRRARVATLIDGQQRLAAIIMFLAFARDRTDDPALIRRLDRALVRRAWFGPALPRLELAQGEHRWFAAHILEPLSTIRLPADAPEGGPSRLLASARFMFRAFAGYTPEDLARLCVFLLDHTAVVLAEAGDGSAALIDFVSHRQRTLAEENGDTPAPAPVIIRATGD